MKFLNKLMLIIISAIGIQSAICASALNAAREAHKKNPTQKNKQAVSVAFDNASLREKTEFNKELKKRGGDINTSFRLPLGLPPLDLTLFSSQQSPTAPSAGVPARPVPIVVPQNTNRSTTVRQVVESRQKAKAAPQVIPRYVQPAPGFSAAAAAAAAVEPRATRRPAPISASSSSASAAPPAARPSAAARPSQVLRAEARPSVAIVAKTPKKAIYNDFDDAFARYTTTDQPNILFSLRTLYDKLSPSDQQQVMKRLITPNYNVDEFDAFIQLEKKRMVMQASSSSSSSASSAAAQQDPFKIPIDENNPSQASKYQQLVQLNKKAGDEILSYLQSSNGDVLIYKLEQLVDQNSWIPTILAPKQYWQALGANPFERFVNEYIDRQKKQQEVQDQYNQLLQHLIQIKTDDPRLKDLALKQALALFNTFSPQAQESVIIKLESFLGKESANSFRIHADAYAKQAASSSSAAAAAAAPAASSVITHIATARRASPTPASPRSQVVGLRKGELEKIADQNRDAANLDFKHLRDTADTGQPQGPNSAIADAASAVQIPASPNLSFAAAPAGAQPPFSLLSEESSLDEQPSSPQPASASSSAAPVSNPQSKVLQDAYNEEAKAITAKKNRDLHDHLYSHADARLSQIYEADKVAQYVFANGTIGVYNCDETSCRQLARYRNKAQQNEAEASRLKDQQRSSASASSSSAAAAAASVARPASEVRAVPMERRFIEFRDGNESTAPTRKNLSLKDGTSHGFPSAPADGQEVTVMDYRGVGFGLQPESQEYIWNESKKQWIYLPDQVEDEDEN